MGDRFKRKSIAIDVDETLADLYWKWLQFYNVIFEDDLQIEDIHSWDIIKYVKEGTEEYFMNILDTHKFYRDLKPKKDSVRVLKELNRVYDIYIVTDFFTRMSFKSKHDWILENYPFLKREQLVFTGSKGIIATDYIIDDALHLSKGFKGEKILFDAPHNQGEDRFYRVYNWRHIEKVFLKNRCMTCRTPLIIGNKFCDTECEEMYLKEFS